MLHLLMGFICCSSRRLDRASTWPQVDIQFLCNLIINIVEISASKFKFFEDPLSMSSLISNQRDNHGFGQLKKSQSLPSMS
jgi:hypothetical protein